MKFLILKKLFVTLKYSIVIVKVEMLIFQNVVITSLLGIYLDLSTLDSFLKEYLIMQVLTYFDKFRFTRL